MSNAESHCLPFCFLLPTENILFSKEVRRGVSDKPGYPDWQYSHKGPTGSQWEVADRQVRVHNLPLLTDNLPVHWHSHRAAPIWRELKRNLRAPSQWIKFSSLLKGWGLEQRLTSPSMYSVKSQHRFYKGSSCLPNSARIHPLTSLI